MKKKRMWFTVLASGLLLLVVGTFAWTNFESSIINFFTGSGANNGDSEGSGNGEATPSSPGGTLHNDFSDEDGYQHFRDVYVENWGTEPLIVRIKLSEYMEVDRCWYKEQSFRKSSCFY